MIPEELLIFAGRGEYPLYALEGARRAGVKRICVAGVRGMASKRLLKLADSSVVFGVGELQTALDWLASSGIKQMMLVGQITPMSLMFHCISRYTAGGIHIESYLVLSFEL